jgi:hypothetical protein
VQGAAQQIAMDKFLNTFWLEQDEPGRAGYGSGRVMGAHSIE